MLTLVSMVSWFLGSIAAAWITFGTRNIPSKPTQAYCNRVENPFITISRHLVLENSLTSSDGT